MPLVFKEDNYRVMPLREEFPGKKRDNGRVREFQAEVGHEKTNRGMFSKQLVFSTAGSRGHDDKRPETRLG